MEKKLYLLVKKGNFVLGGIKGIVGRHFYLELLNDEGLYEITHGMEFGETWCGYGKKFSTSTHINFVNNFLEKGYIESVENPTIYEGAWGSKELEEWLNS